MIAYRELRQVQRDVHTYGVKETAKRHGLPRELVRRMAAHNYSGTVGNMVRKLTGEKLRP